jgi:hypothetical protein
MSSLAALPEVVGFFSYSREDDEDSEGRLSALPDAIQRELSARLGRSRRRDFRLWQDQEAIAYGELWESKVKEGIEQSVFFIPIVTPRAVSSKYCKFEFEAFLVREQELGRTDLVFPLIYFPVPELKNEAQCCDDPVLSAIAARQCLDWEPYRYRDIDTPGVREQLGLFCEKIVGALRKPWVYPEERRKRQEIEGQQHAEEEQQIEIARLRGSGTGSRMQTVFSSNHLSQTMSNPRFEDDLNRLDIVFQRESLINRETIILVVGTGIPAELLDRPVAELLRDQIDKRGGRPNRRGIVVTDRAGRAESKLLADKAVIAIGGPSINASLANSTNLLMADAQYREKKRSRYSFAKRPVRGHGPPYGERRHEERVKPQNIIYYRKMA